MYLYACQERMISKISERDQTKLVTLIEDHTVKTLNIGTPRPATIVVLNIKQFNFTMK